MSRSAALHQSWRSLIQTLIVSVSERILPSNLAQRLSARRDTFYLKVDKTQFNSILRLLQLCKISQNAEPPPRSRLPR